MQRVLWCLLALAISSPAAAQYPDRPATLLAGYPAGGLVDIVARQVAEGMKPRFPRGLVIVNRPGAAGSLAVAETARGQPDGYTFVLTPHSALVIAAQVNDLAYKTPDDYEPFINLVWIGALVTILGIAAAGIRRAGERWWLWGAAACSVLLALMLLVSPVLIDPLFNTYKPLEPGPVRSAVLTMAHATGVPADEVYAFDASRQTKRVSANVSGLGSTAAIRLNDNLLSRTSLPEIRAVMAHELGHYVLNHGPKMLMQFGLLILFGLLFCHWAMRRLFARYGARWGTQSVADVASLPLLTAVFSVFMLAATPVFNTIIRTQEIEADRFGLNLAREPHGFAEVMLKLSDYRKPDAGAVEEFVFFHHPSARHRIHDAMRWREAMGTP